MWSFGSRASLNDRLGRETCLGAGAADVFPADWQGCASSGDAGVHPTSVRISGASRRQRSATGPLSEVGLPLPRRYDIIRLSLGTRDL
jgi:hypothetical protein